MPDLDGETSPTPAGARRPLPTAAMVALACGTALAGCALIVAAVLSLQSDRGAGVVVEIPARMVTRRPATPVPTYVPSETPLPTETRAAASATPTRQRPTPTLVPSITPASATPIRTPTRVKTEASESGAPTSVRPSAATPLPTQTTASTTATGGGIHGIIGQLSLCNPKGSFAAKSDSFEGERICVNELITNTTDQAITYGVLGVRAANISGGASAFQTSWRGNLSVPAHGNGPAGGGWQDGLYLAAGTYSVSLSICYSSVDTCLGSEGNWETLTAGITVNVVPWTPG